MRRCDLFYKKVIEKANWEEDNLCDPPTEPREGIHILIDELLGDDWYVTMPENDNQVITAAVYDIIRKYVDESKEYHHFLAIFMIILTMINMILFVLR